MPHNRVYHTIQTIAKKRDHAVQVRLEGDDDHAQQACNATKKWER